MNLDKLPYETQFKYLANLSFQDVMSYCRSMSVAYDISQTKAFWQYKARESFNIDLDIVDGIRRGNKVATTSAEKYRELEYLYNNEPDILIGYLVEIEDLTAIPGLLKEVVSEKSVLIADVLDIVTAKDSVTLLEAVLEIFKVELDKLLHDGEIEDVLRHIYIDVALRNKMALVNVLKRYYDPSKDESEYLNEWTRNWIVEADVEKIKLLTAAGVQFNNI